MGGNLEHDFYYFAELYWHENSGKTSGSSDFDDFGRTKLADAYLHYVHHWPGDQPMYTSVRFGQFTPYLLHLHGVGARLSQDRPYVVNSGTVGDNPYKPFTRQYGLDVAQHVNGFTATGAVVNGTGGKQFNRVDNDLRKDFWATLDYAFDKQGSMLGVYGYFGQDPLHREIQATYKQRDDFNQFGVLGNFTMNQGALVLGEERVLEGGGIPGGLPHGDQVAGLLRRAPGIRHPPAAPALPALGLLGSRHRRGRQRGVGAAARHLVAGARPRPNRGACAATDHEEPGSGERKNGELAGHRGELDVLRNHEAWCGHGAPGRQRAGVPVFTRRLFQHADPHCQNRRNLPA